MLAPEQGLALAQAPVPVQALARERVQALAREQVPALEPELAQAPVLVPVQWQLEASVPPALPSSGVRRNR